MSARDRECGHGLGKFCREREAAFAERRQILDAAMVPVRQMEDPQLDAAIRIVAWVTYGNAAAVWRRLCNTSSCLAGLAASGRRNPIDGQPISDAVSAPAAARRYSAPASAAFKGISRPSREDDDD